MSERPSNLPALGTAVRHEWPLDWQFLTVNHGSFGATPLVVTAAQDKWRRLLEEQPSRFMRRVLPDALRHAATLLAEFVGAAGEDIAFVENATVGCNAVLRSLRFEPGDEIVVLSHVYGAVRNTVAYVAERSGARIVEATLPFPSPTADAIVASVGNALSVRTRLAVLDHITSSSALVLPIERLAAVCREAGVPVLVDGAHGPGQVGLDLPSLGVDWYVGNCHKWLMSAKGCAFLWARPDRQQDLHPVTISHGFNKGFIAEFDWTGTRDPSAFLSIDAAIDFHHRLGGAALRARNAALAAAGAAHLVARLGTECGASGDLTAAMGVIRLPVGGPSTQERAVVLRGHLLDAGTDAPLHAQAGAIWLRISAQAYNELADYEKLGDIVAAMIKRHD
jgi:isopenicillin-N epimerase